MEAATRGGRLGKYSAPPNLALSVFGTGLFTFLQGRIAETCRNVYPVVSAVMIHKYFLRDNFIPFAEALRTKIPDYHDAIGRGFSPQYRNQK